MTTEFRLDVLTCPMRGCSCSFQLVDEFGDGKAYAGLPYTVMDDLGALYHGTLDADGYAKVDDCYYGPFRLDMSAAYTGSIDPWYEELKIRNAFKIPLTALQVAAEQTRCAHRQDDEVGPAERRAKETRAQYYHLEVRDFLTAADARLLPDASVFRHRPSPFLLEDIKNTARLSDVAEPTGVPLGGDTHNILEIKALRAYSPLLSRDKAFCALNAYQLALMSLLSYGPFNLPRRHDEECTPPPYLHQESIGSVLGDQLPRMLKPSQFSDGKPFHLLCEEVPYSKRLEIMPYDPERYPQEAKDGWQYPEQVHFLNNDGDTQAFITHNDKVLLISVRGTASARDGARDADARQVPHADGRGQAHRGFHDAFLSTKEFVERYLKAFYTRSQTIIVTGHSLGGAIATLMAEWLRREY